MTQHYPERVPIPFPRLRIRNIGAGTVGPVYLYRNAVGEIERAVAKLYDAPFKTMIITSPHLLQIFGEHGDRIDFDSLKHPEPSFRLVESEPGNFETGVLTAIEYVRTNDRIGIVAQGLASSKRLSIVPFIPSKQQTLKTSVSQNEQPAAQPTRISGRNHGGPLVEVSEPNSRRSSQSPQARARTFALYVPGENPPPNVDVAAITSEMDAIRAKIIAVLSEEDREKYTYLLTRGCKTMAKSGAAARERMRDKFRQLFGEYADQFETLARLHNQYAGLLQKVERRFTHHLPMLEDPTLGSTGQAARDVVMG
jgi:hypothetical protein